MTKELTIDEAAQSVNLVPYRQGDLVEVEVLSVSKSRIIVNVCKLNLGVIPAKEMSTTISDIAPGDKILAYVLVQENDDGMVILSLRRADKERIYKTLQNRLETGDPLQVMVKEANRGGLLVVYGDMEGFIPLSQLSPSHYPRVPGGNTGEILRKLQRFVGQFLTVKVLSFERAQNKLIFSEKAAGDKEQEEKVKQFKIGQRLKGKVTGLVNFGLFVDVGGLEGLVHISEVSWDRVEDLKKLYKVGDEVEVEVIAIEGPRVSLSIKRLQKDPWQEEVKKLKVGDKVKGEVTKITPYGAFVRLKENLEGLVHISVLDKSKPEDLFKEGEKYDFEILAIEPEAHKISLKPKSKETSKKETAKAPKTTKTIKTIKTTKATKVVKTTKKTTKVSKSKK